MSIEREGEGSKNKARKDKQKEQEGKNRREGKKGKGKTNDKRNRIFSLGGMMQIGRGRRNEKKKGTEGTERWIRKKETERRTREGKGKRRA